MDYLGHVIRPRMLEIASDTTDAIKELRPVTNITELRSFLGFCNIFRKFVPNFKHIAEPLNRKSQKAHPKEFQGLAAVEAIAMKEFQIRLIAPPVLALPFAYGHITLDTEACNVQVGWVLQQG